MEKRVLIAFFLSIAVLYGSRLLMAPRPATPPPAQTAAGAVQSSTPTPPAPKPAEVTKEVAPPQNDTSSESIEDVVVDTTLYTATLSNHGAILKNFKLKMYTDAEDKPIELIDAMGADKLGWPLTFATLDPKLDEALAKANFAVTRSGTRVVMEYGSADFQARKTIIFDPEKYEFSIATALSRNGKPVPHEITWRSGFGDQPPDPAKRAALYASGGSFKSATIASMKQPLQVTVDHAGVQDQYFLAMFLLGAPAPVKFAKQEYTKPDGKVVATGYVAVPATDQPARVYVGPMDPKWLRKTDEQLQGAIIYGTFGFIAKPLTVALLWIHSYIGNFGWAIIVLTAFINFALFPLRIKQQISMQKMQKIQPQMKTLQDRYKKLKANDPKRPEVQAQMMNLYKEHGVNPMGGCLPLLLQMPFLYAIYTTLAVAIELRHAPFIFWIHDLSKTDPWHIMPLMFGVSMFLQQKMTPTAAMDPAQARMMMIMPVMLTGLFWSSQSGLLLYWLTSNVVGLGQQFLINRFWGAGAGAETPAKRTKKIASDSQDE